MGTIERRKENHGIDAREWQSGVRARRASDARKPTTLAEIPYAGESPQKALEPYQQRVVDEKRELDEKRAKLQAFFVSPMYPSADWAERDRLARQAHAMWEYGRVLGERIAAFTRLNLPRVGKLGLPQWKCHKVVGAAKIVGIRNERGVILELEAAAHSGLEGPGIPMIEHRVPSEWVLKHELVVGGYFVEYEDGYTSFSPAEAFEKGYTRL